MEVPVLETQRLLIRPFVMDDLDAVHQLLDVDLVASQVAGVSPAADASVRRDQRRRWLQWTVLNYGELATLHQPPFGDRALVLKQNAELVGACGFVPMLMPFAQLSDFDHPGPGQSRGFNTMEVGLYWAVSPRHQRRGYASEAGRALVDFAFEHLNLERIVADTRTANEPSIGVMRKLGMRILRNPLADPAWMQVVGVLDRPRSTT